MGKSLMESQAQLWTRSTQELPPQATMEEIKAHISYLRALESGTRRRAQILQKLFLDSLTTATELSTQRLKLERLFVPVTKITTQSPSRKKPQSLAELISGLGMTPEAALTMLQDLAEKGE